ncbi:MFS transporter [Pseudonocardia zijingensis]|uniref:MFS transporter n=1 Tax=Pseudonocardia zijingensis TaxID=153376 RepID=A0ABN1N9T6_9PSEU
MKPAADTRSADGTEPAAEQKINKRYVVALGGGMAVEWFDFSVYGLVAALLAPHFFPGDDAVASTLSALAVFAVGFVARPLAAVFFGPLADRIGHKKVLLASITAMAASTLMMGLLPTYDQIGLWAGVALVAARLIQGLSTGIEQAVGNAAALELAGPRNRGRFATTVSGSILQAGILLAALVCFLVSAVLGGEAMAEWGWRVPFIIGGLSGLVIFYLRRSLPETGATAEVEGPPRSSADVWRELWRHRLGLFAVIFVVAGTQVANYAWTVGMPNMARSVFGEDPTQVFAVMTGLGCIMVAVGPLAGSLCDRYTNSKIFTLFRLGLVPTLFTVLLYQQPGIWTFAVVVLGGGILVSLNQVLFNYIISTLMPDSCRTTGVAIGYGLAMTVFGGTASYVLVWLQRQDAFWAFPVYGAAVCIVSVVLYDAARRRGHVHIGR